MAGGADVTGVGDVTIGVGLGTSGAFEVSTGAFPTDFNRYVPTVHITGCTGVLISSPM